MLEAKYYTAKIENWALKFVGVDDKPMAEVTFSIKVGDEEYKAPYRGFLTEKAKQYTVRDLVTMGFNDKDMTAFAHGLERGALDVSQEYRVKVVLEEYKGKQFPKVKGIYSTKSKSELTFDGLAKAGKISVAGEVLAAKGPTGTAKTTLSKTPLESVGGDNADLPF